jgi:hypothetical protein
MRILEGTHHEVWMEGDRYIRMRPLDWYYWHRDNCIWEYIPYAEAILLEEEFNDTKNRN